MTDSITAAMDDLQIAAENYASLLTQRIRSGMATEASDAIMRFYSQKADEGKVSGEVLGAIMKCADLAWEAGR